MQHCSTSTWDLQWSQVMTQDPTGSIIHSLPYIRVNIFTILFGLAAKIGQNFFLPIITPLQVKVSFGWEVTLVCVYRSLKCEPACNFWQGSVGLEASRLIKSWKLTGGLEPMGSWKLSDTGTRKEGVSDGKPDEPSPGETAGIFSSFPSSIFPVGSVH